MPERQIRETKPEKETFHGYPQNENGMKSFVYDTKDILPADRQSKGVSAKTYMKYPEAAKPC